MTVSPTPARKRSPGITSYTTNFHGVKARQVLLFATVLTVILNFVPYAEFVLYPIRLFVTFVHEAGHAVAALISGGSVHSLAVHKDGSGLTQTLINPIWGWLVWSGGYLGTAIFGAILLQIGRLGHRANAGRIALAIMGISLLVIAPLWGWRDISGFTLITGLSLGAILLAMAKFLPLRGSEFAATFLAVQCCLNALLDLKILLHLTAMGSAHNDAAFMAQHYALPAVFWAVLWGAVAAGILALSLRGYWRATQDKGAIMR
jgi:hypothetical protein